MLEIISIIYYTLFLLSIIYLLYLIIKVAVIIQADLTNDEKIKQLKKLLIRKDRR